MNLLTVLGVFIYLASCNAQNTVKLIPINGKINSPVAMDFPADGSNRLFVCEQNGIIRIIKSYQIQVEPFLDIRNRLLKQLNVYSERGLLGLAFHPQYKNNGKFYVYYSAASKQSGSNHKSVIAEYLVQKSNPDKADWNSERIILEIEEPESNHNGGHLVFGKDGYLYIGVGDGGGANDQHGSIGNGQNMQTLLGKILRVDVNTSSGYRVPSDNPFVGKPVKSEIWATGLRNPWKFSFDKVTGKLFCADVGQEEYEEINIIEKGKNYGWRIMEGNHCFNPKTNCNRNNLVLPIIEYTHEVGVCIIGGYVYRGLTKSMQGKYIFGDWMGKLFVGISGTNWRMDELSIDKSIESFSINSFGEDANGEIYVLGQPGIGAIKEGVIYKLEFTD